MSRVFVHGWGAVSPAGWGTPALLEAWRRGEPVVPQPLARPGQPHPAAVRKVPPPTPRPAFLGHPRLRRTSPITHFAVGAAIEALGADAAKVAAGQLRLGLVFCAFTGCVSYSRRFYDEVLREPATASPLIFPETVFNAPASHLAAFFGSPAVNYTLVGDEGEFLKGVALAAEWLLADRVDGCLVVGAEETDWLSAEALRLLSPRTGRMGVAAPSGTGALAGHESDGRPRPQDSHSRGGCATGERPPAPTLPAEGAGALYLRRESGPVELLAVTSPQLFQNRAEQAAALARVRSEWRPFASPDSRLHTNAGPAPGAVPSLTEVLGEGLGALGGWQSVAAVAELASSNPGTAIVETVGLNEQVVAAVFRRGG